MVGKGGLIWRLLGVKVAFCCDRETDIMLLCGDFLSCARGIESPENRNGKCV